MELGSGCVREEVEEDQQVMMRSSSNSGGSSSSSSSKGKLPFLYGTTSTSSFPTSSFYTQKGHYYHPQAPLSLPLPSSNPTTQEEEFEDQGGGGGGGREPNTNTNNSEVVVIEKEHMFDKVVTPSDVGKLNRLVIPKQHAEKYFPLDSSTNEKGLLLNFEDRTGKPWRFRYSYWNSSQSYVMTKGWSRFVKEKKLDAGDIVSFQRGVGELVRDRLYIDWRKRPNAPDPNTAAPFYNLQQYHHFSNSYPWSGTTSYNNFTRPPPTTPASILPRDYHLYWGNPARTTTTYNNAVASGGLYGYGGTASIPPGGTFIYMRPAAVGQVVKYQQQGSGSGGGVVEPVVYESVPVVQGKQTAAPKRLRLFGVNMECPITCTDTDPNSGEENKKLSSSTSTPTTSTFLTLQAPSPTSQMRFHNGSSIAASTSVSNVLLSSTQKGKPSSSSMSLDLSDDSEPR